MKGRMDIRCTLPQLEKPCNKAASDHLNIKLTYSSTFYLIQNLEVLHSNILNGILTASSESEKLG